MSNLIVVAKFFYYIYKAILDGLFDTNTRRISILRNLLSYFAIIETNS
jgi:hypothetical protein